MKEYKRMTKQSGWKADMDLTQEMGYSWIYQRLSELENKIEQGTLKEIPCKVGDTLYTSCRWQGDYLRKKAAPYPISVVFIGVNGDAESGGGFVNVVYPSGRMWQFNFSDFGKTVFLTREEAEKRLKELKKCQN